jgi:parallel beta-helix repeat protein
VLFSVVNIASATDIDNCIVIDKPGYYRLTRDIIDTTAEVCINITVNNVIFDGGGHLIDSATSNVSGHWRYGIRLYNASSPGNPLRNVTIMNVKLRDWNVSDHSVALSGCMAIYFKADGGRISNVEIENSGVDYYAGARIPLSVLGDYNTINNVRIRNCGGMIILGGKYNTFENSVLNGTSLKLMSSYSTVRNVTISNVASLAINIEYESFNKILGCRIYNSLTGIRLLSSTYNRIEGCEISDCKYGIVLGGTDPFTGYPWGSRHCIIKDNVIKDCKYGISLQGTNNTLRGNRLINNTYGLQIYGFAGKYTNKDEPYFYYFLNDIDTSNTIDGRSIYYILNATDVVYDSSTNAAIFYCINCSNIVVKDLTLRKSDVGLYLIGTKSAVVENVTTTDNNYGIVLNWVSDVKVLNCNLSNNSQIGVYLRGVWYEVPPVKGFNDRIEIKGCKIVNNAFGGGIGGISIKGSRNVSIGDTLICNNARGSGISIYCRYGYTSDIRIQNVTVGCNGHYGIIAHGSNKLSNVTVKNSRIYDNDYGIYVEGNGHTIANNYIYNNNFGIQLSVDNSTVVGNLVKGNSNGIVVKDGGEHNDIRSNVVENNRGDGVLILDKNNRVTDNIIRGNKYGLHLGGKYNYIANNTIENNTRYGVWVSGNYNRIINNTVKDNGDFGFYTSNYYNWIEGNIVNGDEFYYLFNKSHVKLSNVTVDNAKKTSNLGCIVVVKSNNVTLENAVVSNSSERGSGLFIYETVDSVFRNVTAFSNYNGIKIWKSSNVSLVNCTVFDNDKKGVYILYSNDVNIANSIMESNCYGVYIQSAANVTLYNDTITSNVNCVSISDSENVSIISGVNVIVPLRRLSNRFSIA